MCFAAIALIDGTGVVDRSVLAGLAAGHTVFNGSPMEGPAGFRVAVMDAVMPALFDFNPDLIIVSAGATTCYALISSHRAPLCQLTGG